MKKGFLTLAIGAVFATPSWANDLDDLLELDFDDLSGFDIEMETAAKNTQSLNDIPASVYVISNERIVRSGYSTIAEMLSLVPGFLSTKYSENGFEVSSKGFHDSFYNKLLIMVDGRSVFSPIYGGTYMADLDYLISDIEQIEVVRGPAGTMWGANSANGVVNIITKSAQNAQGTHVSAYVGDYNNYSAEIRHGFSFGDYSFAKVFYKHKHSPTTLEEDAYVRESHQYGGSYELYSDKHTLLAQVGGETSKEGYLAQFAGTYYDSFYDEYYYDSTFEQSEMESHSWYLNLKHQYQISTAATYNTNLYVNYDKDNDPFAAGNYITSELDTFLTQQVLESSNFTLGGGVRLVNIDFDHHIQDIDYNYYQVGVRAGVYEQQIRDYTFNLYGQFETWWNDKLKTVVGVKYERFEQNDTNEISPQLRALYNLNTHHSFWGGVARAVMLPSYIDTQMDEFFYNEYLPDVYLSDPKLENESVVTAELGYRFSPDSKLDVDTVIFASKYENLRGISYMYYGYAEENRVAESDFYDPWMSGAYMSKLNSDYDATTWGAELAFSYSPVKNWSLYGTYAYLNIETDWNEKVREDEWVNPEYNYGELYYDIEAQHTATLQSLWSVTEQFDIDLTGRYFYQKFNSHPDISMYEVDPFATLDARAAWQKNENWPTVELIAQNLVGAGYKYLNADYAYVNERKWYARVSYDF